MKREMKYIVYDNGWSDIPIIFPVVISHDQMAFNLPGASRDNIIAAGFCQIIDGEICCYGESTTLKKQSRPEDSQIINQMLKDV